MWKFIGRGHMRTVKHSSEGFPDFILYQEKKIKYALGLREKNAFFEKKVNFYVI